MRNSVKRYNGKNAMILVVHYKTGNIYVIFTPKFFSIRLGICFYHDRTNSHASVVSSRAGLCFMTKKKLGMVEGGCTRAHQRSNPGLI